ncbi:deoxyribonuclease-1-like [Seriola lalandi dorsalis]|uniref:deoxyribonuclease-1-like n=1 Tax=Seriola lalandi dorsalis TaxID=1841481 RepID=UPI000C6F5D96|nr:deoxyribonuclease-1-like [Seriola lalandi dorsalis]
MLLCLFFAFYSCFSPDLFLLCFSFCYWVLLLELEFFKMRLVCALGLFMTLLHLSTSLLLGAFNIKSFGDKKASNTTLMNIISTIVHRYDIILIQEVRDGDLSATNKLMEHVNKGSPEFRYRHIVSEPLGRSSYKERYLFLYRYHRITLSLQDIVLLGDFNAGCNYVSGSDWQKIRLFTDKSFLWLITDEADTTVSHTNCPYDRIVVTTDMMKGVVQRT